MPRGSPSSSPTASRRKGWRPCPRRWIYLHLDLDVLDAVKVGKANEFALEGGPDSKQLGAVIGLVRGRFDVVAAGIASYDPAFDADGRVLRAAIAGAGEITPARNPAAPTEKDAPRES